MIEIAALFCYNLSMKTQERSAAEWRALLDKKEDEIAFLHRQIDWLTQQLRLVRGQRFGASQRADTGDPGAGVSVPCGGIGVM